MNNEKYLLALAEANKEVRKLQPLMHQLRIAERIYEQISDDGKKYKKIKEKINRISKDLWP